MRLHPGKYAMSAFRELGIAESTTATLPLMSPEAAKEFRIRKLRTVASW